MRLRAGFAFLVFVLGLVLSSGCSGGDPVASFDAGVLVFVDAAQGDSARRDGGPLEATVDGRTPLDAPRPPVDSSVDATPEGAAPPDSAVHDAGVDANVACVGQPNGTLCGPGLQHECCGGLCSDPFTDSANCLGCGLACPAGATCNGQCVVSSCQVGDDNKVCIAAFFSPDAGFTEEYATCCGRTCSVLASDPTNCGACGHACPATSTCSNGQCTTPTSCGPENSGVACPLDGGSAGTCCAGICAPGFSADPSNCGACGASCPAGSSCVNSTCVAPDAGAAACPSGTALAAINANGQKACVPFACPAGVSGISCLFGDESRWAGYPSPVAGQCCDGVCADTLHDPAHCGSCGVSCASGQCQANFPGEATACVPVPTAPPQGATCGAPSVWAPGQCLAPGCQGPFGYCALGGTIGVCASSGFSATCVNLATDPANCGALYVHCPVGQTCVGGACSGDVAPCGPGREGSYCALAPDGSGTSNLCCAGGGCTDTMSDAANCGACGNACAAGLSCVAGKCEALSCQGLLDGMACGAGALGKCCGGLCKTTATDALNCGACGVQCAGVETCAGGLCGVAACTAVLQGDPCHLPAGAARSIGGCCATSCVDTQSDPANCGGCNLPCAAGTTCVVGSCK